MADTISDPAVVTGLDLSLTATGMAHVTNGDWYVVTTVKSTGKRSDSLKQRRDRIDSIVGQVLDFASGSDLVVLEGPSLMSKGGSNWDRAWLWGAVVGGLLDRYNPVAVAPPTVVKKWATNRGNADKAAVAVGVARLWDGFEPKSDNESDALALATMGAQFLDLPVQSRSHHAETLTKVEWPMDCVAELKGKS